MSNNTLFIVGDNQDITKAGLYRYIFDMFGKHEINDVTNKENLISALMENNVDIIVVIDYALFDFKGLDELIVLGNRFPDVRWVLFSNEMSEDFIRRMSGEKTFSMVLKENSGDEIRSALKCAFNKERFLCHQITNLLLNRTDIPVVNTILTTTEIDILKLIAHGKSVKEIAVLRTCSIHTIVTHKKNIFRKLAVNNVYEATKYALRAGLIEIIEYYI